MIRSLLHYRQLNAAVLFGVAVAAAVLTGALMVGDSVRGSLKALTFDRLGHIDYALAPDHFLPDDLPRRLAQTAGDGTLAEGLVMMRGSMKAGNGKRATGVQILGVTPTFDLLYPKQIGLKDTLVKAEGQIWPSAVLNQSLATELGVTIGDELLLSFENIADINRDSVYGEKDSDEVIKRLRLTLSAITPDQAQGRFSLIPHQSQPKNIYLPRDVLQRALDRTGEINVVLVGRPDADGGYGETMKDHLRKALQPGDLDAALRAGPNYVALETPRFFLNETLAQSAREVADKLQLETIEVSSYLGNKLSFNGNLLPYSLVTAMTMGTRLSNPTPAEGKTEAQPGEIVLTRWAADDLGAAIGDELELTFFAMGQNEALIEDVTTLTLVGIIPMEGIAVDPSLTPDFPGIDDADNLSDWDPPFPMEMNLIRDKDEVFWDQYRTASKMFVHHDTGRELWETRFGYLTSLRFAAPEGTEATQLQQQFQRELMAHIQPEAAGLTVAPLKEVGVDAASGSTDFTGLFIGLSFFIIISALLLVGLFFQLTVAQRMPELGILAATGFTTKAIRSRFMREGLLLCTLGSLVGSLGGLLYAKGVMAGLRNWWYLGTSNLYFHFEPVSLIVGFVIAVFVGAFTIWTAVRKASKLSVTRLVSGQTSESGLRTGKKAQRVFLGSLILAVLMMACSFFMPPQGLFFGVGSLLLIAGLALIATRLADRRVVNGIAGTISMASRNMSRQAGRTLVCVSLIAGACYVIVAVGLYRNDGIEDTDRLDSGAGGYFLEATAEIPLHGDLQNDATQLALGIDEDLIQQLADTQVLPMRLRGGDDTSCLNLFAPGKPRLLGIPQPKALNGRFRFGGLVEDNGVPWDLLNKTFDDGAIPVIGDANSMQWILKLKLGGDLVMTDEYGVDVTLRLVGVLQKGSIFQSELLMSEANFLKMFPSESGYGYFLFGSKAENRDALAGALEAGLEDYGVDAVYTAEKIKAFHEVENTYISIFQMLGGLGLLLGTLGMGAVIYRNAFERKSEFAAMRAFGFRGSRITSLLLAENTVLLAAGIAIGTVSAVISMAPQLVAAHQMPSVSLLAWTLVGVFLVGITASLWAVYQVRKFPLLSALRAR